MPDRTCSVVDCEQPAQTRGWCNKHYKRWLNTGNPLTARPRRPRDRIDAEARFLSKIDREPDGCWRWTAAKLPAGYGLFWDGQHRVYAHRWAYGWWVGPVPEGQDVDHFRFPQDGCIGPACVNPEHLRPASHRENVLRGGTVFAENLAKTHCLRNHPFDEANTYIRPNTGERTCRTCARMVDRRRGPRRRALQRRTEASNARTN